MKSGFYRSGLKFSCQRCSHCCRHEPGFVFLSKGDMSRLSAGLGVSEGDFAKKFCRVVPYFDGSLVLSLLEKPNFDCIFWNAGCTVYEFRPSQCRSYPFWESIVKSEESWREEAASCPGIGRGETVSAEKIEKALAEGETPLRVDFSCGGFFDGKGEMP